MAVWLSKPGTCSGPVSFYCPGLMNEWILQDVFLDMGLWCLCILVTKGEAQSPEAWCHCSHTFLCLSWRPGPPLWSPCRKSAKRCWAPLCQGSQGRSCTAVAASAMKGQSWGRHQNFVPWKKGSNSALCCYSAFPGCKLKLFKNWLLQQLQPMEWKGHCQGHRAGSHCSGPGHLILTFLFYVDLGFRTNVACCFLYNTP